MKRKHHDDTPGMFYFPLLMHLSSFVVTQHKRSSDCKAVEDIVDVIDLTALKSLSSAQIGEMVRIIYDPRFYYKIHTQENIYLQHHFVERETLRSFSHLFPQPYNGKSVGFLEYDTNGNCLLSVKKLSLSMHLVIFCRVFLVVLLFEISKGTARITRT